MPVTLFNIECASGTIEHVDSSPDLHVKKEDGVIQVPPNTHPHMHWETLSDA